MTKLTLTVLGLTLVSTGLSLAGMVPLLVPQSIFALALSVALLNVITQSDEARVQ